MIQTSVHPKMAGFSLPEILIVVLTASILAVLAIPQLNSSLRLNRLQTASSIITNKLADAKTNAIKRNRQVSLVVDEVNRKVWVEVNSTVIGTVETLPDEIKIKISPDTSATKEYVTFNSMGALSSTPPTILPYQESRRLELPVTVSVSGKIGAGNIRTY